METNHQLLTDLSILSHDQDALIELISNLEKKQTELKFLCQNLDPFKAQTAEDNARLKKFNLHLIDDPYRLTAELITLMEDTLTELNALKSLLPTDGNREVTKKL